MEVNKRTPGKPPWLRVRYAENQNRKDVEQTLAELGLNTVCAEANCPNYMECFSRRTATFLIMGIICTRACGFCNVNRGDPQELNPQEPENIAQAVKALALTYAVVTSVTRDDLDDGGAGHFAKVIYAIQNTSAKTVIEVLVPDFKGNMTALETVAGAFPAVISHNMETVKSLYARVRPQAEYRRSLDLIKHIRQFDPRIRAKSGILVGLGETKEQVHQLFDDLRESGCEFLTIGQYLAPSKQHLPVKEYITPAQFEAYRTEALHRGFTFVMSAPLVRSSFRAGEAFGI